jgi:glycosyltransferase involved in cell wall biosynthesis
MLLILGLEYITKLWEIWGELLNMPKKKIALLATVYRHLEAFHIPYINLLQDKGFEIHAYASPDHGKEGIQKQNVICHDISFSRNPYSIGNIKAYFQLINSFKQEQFHLLHTHTPVASLIGRIAAKKAQIPNVFYTAHGFHFFKGAPIKDWILYYTLEKLTARFIDFLITINKEDFTIAKKFPVRKRVFFVPGVGVSTDYFDPKTEALIRIKKRKELGLNQDDTVILSVAELNTNKNQIQLIKAVKELNIQTVKCLLVGQGEDMNYLKNIITNLGLDNNIKLLGFRNDIRELLAASDIFALMSKREGLPKAILEALSAGKPIIATNVRGNRDLVMNGLNGYLVPVSDIDRTVEAFNILIYNSDDRLIMGNNSKGLSANYDLKKIVCDMEKIYGEAL